MSELKDKLNKYGVVLKKKYGQNFLSDSAVLNKIADVAEIDNTVSVLEIGCGAGALTQVLCKRAKKVVGYEIDVSLKPVLADALSFADNVEIVFKDVMKESVSDVEKKIGGKYVLVANLPYYITTPVVTRFLENANDLVSMVIMVQEEVADRFSAKPKTSEYGAITVAINLRGRAEKAFRVGREKFTPVPNVDSAVVKIIIDRDKFEGVDLNKTRDVVRAAFSSRRKTLVNNLIIGYKMSRETAAKIVESAGFSEKVRGEELSAEDFAFLAEKIGEYEKN